MHVATAILIPWPAAIGYRRFYQGILVRHGLTRRVAYGTVVRLTSMSVTAPSLALTTSLARREHRRDRAGLRRPDGGGGQPADGAPAWWRRSLAEPDGAGARPG